MYNISYTGQLFNTSTQYVRVDVAADMYTSPVSVDISELEEYTNYTISVSAINEVGDVVISAEVTRMTNISGMILRYFDIYSLSVLYTTVKILVCLRRVSQYSLLAKISNNIQHFPFSFTSSECYCKEY